MRKTYHLLIPEYVPLENKGEEAIVRGISEVLFPEGNCELHLFDLECERYYHRDGIHVYPGKWFFASWMLREFGIGWNAKMLRDSACSLIRNGLHKTWPNFAKRRPTSLSSTETQMRRLVDGASPTTEKERCLQRLLACDYVVAGHDGALNEQVCHVIDVMRELGKASGIFGVSLRSSFRSEAIIEVHRATLQHCQFLYCRNTASVETVNRYFPNLTPQLAPDPAFGMRPATAERVDEIIAKESLNTFFQKPVVMCTACEPAPIARHCFEATPARSSKCAMHRKLLADLVRHVVHKHDVNVLFLPHSIGPGIALDDRIVAADVAKRTGLPQDRLRVLTHEYSGKELKGLIGRAELLVAERIHSMIGATGMHTPFLCLGSHTDRRIKGIIENMLALGEAVYFLNRPNISHLKAKFDQVWQTRAGLRQHLAGIADGIQNRLDEAAAVIRRCISEDAVLQ